MFEVYPVSNNLKAIVNEICPHKNQSANFKMLHLTSEDMTQYFKKVTIVIMAKTRENSLNAYYVLRPTECQLHFFMKNDFTFL